MVDFFGLIDIPWWMLLLLICLFVYHKLTDNYDTWRQRGIPGPKPVALLGTMNDLLKHGMKESDRRMRKYGRVVGGFDGKQPVLYVYDAAMLKEIMVKQFDCFVNRRVLEGATGSFKDMITTITDDKWRKVRNHITPSFTSGKLKGMFPNVRKTARLLLEKLEEDMKKVGKINARERYGAYTMDVIALTAFGIDANSLNEPNNEFIQNALRFFELSVRGALILFLFLAPKILILIDKLGLLPWVMNENFMKAENFFRTITANVMKEREDNKSSVTQTDFISLCMQANKEEIKEEKRLTQNEIMAQAMLFFVAGYETTQTTITFLSYNLARNPELQDKLCAEIDSIFDENDDIDYEKLQKMTYFEQCLEESMRMYSPAIRAERTCNRDTVVNGVPIRKGDVVAIPIQELQQDDEVYPEPTKFDPERFNAENKAKRNQFNWLAFGMGPRNCIGMRLALLEIRLALVTVLRSHKFIEVKETIKPDVITWKTSGNLIPNESIYLGIEKRKN